MQDLNRVLRKQQSLLDLLCKYERREIKIYDIMNPFSRLELVIGVIYPDQSKIMTGIWTAFSVGRFFSSDDLDKPKIGLTHYRPVSSGMGISADFAGYLDDKTNEYREIAGKLKEFELI